jgi:processing peptidase subunit beta
MEGDLLRMGRGPGGLRAAAVRLPGRRVAAIAAGVPFGARDDPPGQEGLAHLLEHVLFRGGPTGDAEATARAFAQAGTDANAVTTHDDLRLDALTSPEAIGPAARLLGGVLHAPRLEDADVEHERRVVLQELAERSDAGDVGELLDAACWGRHSLARPIVGTRESIGRLQGAALRHAARRHLGPATTCAVAAGDADPDAMLRALLDGFGGGGAAQAPRRRAPRFVGGIEWSETDAADPVADVALAYPAPAAGAADADAAHLAAALLGGAPTGLLFQALRERHGLAYGVEARLEQGEDWGRLCIELRLPADRLSDGLVLLAEVLDARYGRDVLEDARRMEILRQASLLDASDGLAQALLDDLLGGRTPVPPSERLARLRQVTDEAVEAALRRMLAGPPALAVVGPAPRRRALARTRFADLVRRLPR